MRSIKFDGGQLWGSAGVLTRCLNQQSRAHLYRHRLRQIDAAQISASPGDTPPLSHK